MKFTIGYSFFNSKGNLLTIKSLSKDEMLVSSKNWSTKYWYPIKRAKQHIQSGFYTVNKVKSLNKKFTMNSFYVLKRQGEFIIDDLSSSTNQCYKEKHPLYNYYVICAVEDNLDYQGFIVDHESINRVINDPYKSKTQGSCENMHSMLHKRITKMPELKGKLIALKTIIKPAGVHFSAHMEKIWFKPKYDKNTLNLIMSQLNL